MLPAFSPTNSLRLDVPLMTSISFQYRIIFLPRCMEFVTLFCFDFVMEIFAADFCACVLTEQSCGRAVSGAFITPAWSMGLGCSGSHWSPGAPECSPGDRRYSRDRRAWPRRINSGIHRYPGGHTHKTGRTEVAKRRRAWVILVYEARHPVRPCSKQNTFGIGNG